MNDVNEVVVPEQKQVAEEAIVPAAAAEGEVTDGAATEKAEATAETTEQTEAHKQSKFQRRLERQKTARIQAETEAKILRERVAQLEAQSKPTPASDEPKRDQFDDYETYLEARTEYKATKAAEKVLTTDREQAQARTQQSTQTAAQNEVAKAWNERESAFEKVTGDYTEIVTPFVEDEISVLSDGARRMMVESEVGPKLLYHLATHADVVERIAELSPVRQIAELAKLEDKFSAPASKTTSAPAPASHVNASKTGAKDPSKMNQTEFRKWMADNGSRFVRRQSTA